MYAIVGQKNLVQTLSNLTPATMPAAMLLLGPSGAGKTFIISRFAKKLGLPLITITKDTTAEDLIAFEQSPELKLYYIDLVGIEEKQQNKFLKFIEEPGERVRVILEAESEIGILPTILNRCQKFNTERYSIEELQSFSWAPKSDNPLIYEFCKTPGQLLNLAETSCFTPLYEYCCAILESFPRFGNNDYSRAMAACTRISTKKPNFRKFELNLFLDMLTFASFNKYVTTGDDFSFQVYSYTIKQRQKIMNKSITKEDFVLNFLNAIWRISRHDFS